MTRNLTFVLMLAVLFTCIGCGSDEPAPETQVTPPVVAATKAISASALLDQQTAVLLNAQKKLKEEMETMKVHLEAAERARTTYDQIAATLGRVQNALKEPTAVPTVAK